MHTLADPSQIFDPFVGSLSLTGAVLGGTISAAFVAQDRRRTGAVAGPTPRPCRCSSRMGFGKLAQLLGGSGQGLPFDGPWAVAFLGSGPWISADPALPSHPSQVYEGLWALAGIPIVLAWVERPSPAVRWRRGQGSLFVGCPGLVPAGPHRDRLHVARRTADRPVER